MAGLWAWGLRTTEYPAPVLAGRLETVTLEHRGLSRRFHWYRPARSSDPAPVVLVLHGSAAHGERMRSATGWAFDELADREGFIPVYPDGFEGHWNDCRRVGDFAAKAQAVDDVDFLRAVVARLAAQVPVATAQVYAFGLSNGGQMALRLAQEAPDFVAGVAAVAAGLPAPDNQACTPTDRALPVLVISGTGDPISPYGGGEVTILGPFGARGRVQSAEDTVGYFRTLAGHQEPGFQHRFPDGDPDDGTVASRQVWAAEGRPEVALITIHDGGHTIPHPRKAFPRILGRTSHDLSAAEESWRFFARHTPAAGAAEASGTPSAE